MIRIEETIEEAAKSGHLVDLIRQEGVSSVEETFDPFGPPLVDQWEELWRLFIEAGNPAPEIDAPMLSDTVTVDFGGGDYEQDVLITEYNCAELGLSHETAVSCDWDEKGRWVCEPADPDPQNESDCLLGLLLALGFSLYNGELEEPSLQDISRDRFRFDSSVYYTDEENKRKIIRIFRGTYPNGNPDFRPVAYKCDLSGFPTRYSSIEEMRFEIRRKIEERGMKISS